MSHWQNARWQIVNWRIVWAFVSKSRIWRLSKETESYSDFKNITLLKKIHLKI
jgi:hypothetical protein